MMNVSKPVSRQTNIVVQELENEFLIYDLSINKAFCLNQTSALVFQLCDGKNSVAEISDLMSKKLKTLVSEDLVWLALEGLRKDNLLENDKELTNHLAGLSRREAVKKVGLASMVALPVIASVVAPDAVMAQSGVLLAVNSPCTSNGQCMSNFCAPTNMCCAVGTTFWSPPGGVCVCGSCNQTLAMNCCSGIIIDNGTSPCGGAGNCCTCG